MSLPSLPGWNQLDEVEGEDILVKPPLNSATRKPNDYRMVPKAPRSMSHRAKLRAAERREQSNLILELQPPGQGKGKPKDMHRSQYRRHTQHAPPSNQDMHRDMLGPIPMGPQRDEIIDYIATNVQTICKSDGLDEYVYGVLGYSSNGERPASYPPPGPMGSVENPFLWVLADHHGAGNNLQIDVVYAFCMAALHPLDEDNIRIYNVDIVCSHRSGGMQLFRAALEYAKQIEAKGDSVIEITVEALTPELTVSYNTIARQVFGYPMTVRDQKYMNRIL